MSGGSYNYAYRVVEDFADSMSQSSPARTAFYALLYRVAEAMHNVEWVDSGDYGKGDEDKAIMACLGQGDIQRAAVERLRAALAEYDRGSTQ
jgi:hypothetical protein